MSLDIPQTHLDISLFQYFDSFKHCLADFNDITEKPSLHNNFNDDNIHRSGLHFIYSRIFTEIDRTLLS